MRSYYSAPHPPPSPPPTQQQIVSLSQSSYMSPVELTDGRGDGRGARSYDGEKAWPSINYSVLSGYICYFAYTAIVNYPSHSNEKKKPVIQPPTGIATAHTFFMDQITIKTPNPKCRFYWCLIEFIDWRYSQSCWYF